MLLVGRVVNRTEVDAGSHMHDVPSRNPLHRQKRPRQRGFSAENLISCIHSALINNEYPQTVQQKQKQKKKPGLPLNHFCLGVDIGGPKISPPEEILSDHHSCTSQQEWPLRPFTVSGKDHIPFVLEVCREQCQTGVSCS